MGDLSIFDFGSLMQQICRWYFSKIQKKKKMSIGFRCLLWLEIAPVVSIPTSG